MADNKQDVHNNPSTTSSPSQSGQSSHNPGSHNAGSSQHESAEKQGEQSRHGNQPSQMPKKDAQKSEHESDQQKTGSR